MSAPTAAPPATGDRRVRLARLGGTAALLVIAAIFPLVVTDTQGNALDMPDNIRLFFLSNLQHFALANAKPELVKTCAFPTNPLNAGPSVRALLTALDSWISNGTLPPASRYPSRKDDTLVTPEIVAANYPHIPGFAYPSRMARPAVIKSEALPPSKGADYPVFVPRTDADGRDIAGLHLPTLEAPAATHTGWNLRKAGFSEGELCENNGSMIPFAATREERLKSNDPRLSMAERYPNDGDRAYGVSNVDPGPKCEHHKNELQNRQPCCEPQSGKSGLGDHFSSVFPALCSAARLPSSGGM